MRRHLQIGALVCLLSVWMQTLVPAALAHAAFDPFAVICHHASTGDGPAAPTDHSDCGNCLLCHASLAGLGGAPHPALPVRRQAGTLAAGWPRVAVDVVESGAGLAGRPRGPPEPAEAF